MSRARRAAGRAARDGRRLRSDLRRSARLRRGRPPPPAVPWTAPISPKIAAISAIAAKTTAALNAVRAVGERVRLELLGLRRGRRARGAPRPPPPRCSPVIAVADTVTRTAGRASRRSAASRSAWPRRCPRRGCSTPDTAVSVIGTKTSARPTAITIMAGQQQREVARRRRSSVESHSSATPVSAAHPVAISGRAPTFVIRRLAIWATTTIDDADRQEREPGLERAVAEDLLHELRQEEEHAEQRRGGREHHDVAARRFRSENSRSGISGCGVRDSITRKATSRTTAAHERQHRHGVAPAVDRGVDESVHQARHAERGGDRAGQVQPALVRARSRAGRTARRGPARIPIGHVHEQHPPPGERRR